MAESSGVTGYSRQFALRQPVAARKTVGNDNFNAKKASKRPIPWKLRDAAASTGPKTSCQMKKTLVDAFKQHGMRLCDGARLNAVGKGVHVLGRVPPTVCASVTALYLSQNNLQTLDGIEQFAAVRLLSVGGNLVASDKEVARLAALEQLRNLNLMGNPLCDQPNYRLRIVAMLTKLQVLDNTDITKKERDAAAHVAAQDDALRTMVTQNHFDIQKLQRIAQLVALHKEFYGRVMAGVATGRFDRVPSPSDVACNVLLFLRVWKYENALSDQELDALRVQMLTIIVRTHAKLADHPKVKAKDYLLKLAKGSSPRAQRLDGASNDLKQRCASWEEAYGNVISLQQKTIANLHALCEKNRKEMVEYLKDLLSMDPRQRNKKVGYQQVQRYGEELEMKPPPGKNATRTQSRAEADSRLTERQKASSICSVDARSSRQQLPPQQQDPDTRERQAQVAYPPPLPMFSESTCYPLSPSDRRKTQAPDSYLRAPEEAAQGSRDRKTHLRSGDFANKSLGEAIHSFKLRDSVLDPPLKPPGPTSKISQVHRVYTMQRQDRAPLPCELTEKQRPLLHPSGQRLRGNREMNRSRQETEVATEFNYSQRRVSSAFTREDLDMTNSSEISHASPSPRARCANEEPYIPIAQSPPNPLSEGRHNSVLASTTRSLRLQPMLSSPQAVPEPQVPAVVANDGRLQELEQREQKYIRALMQSEQRELDLRNNLSSVQRKLASYQRTLAQQLHEREAIKEEVAQRTAAVAAPKILTRFFIRWIRFYNWSQQVKHVQRKRCFIVQHDRFWLWRRNVWRQQELRACRKKQQLRVRRLHFTEWVNVTRVSVIARRNSTVRETRFLKSVLRVWTEAVAVVKRERKLHQAKLDEAMKRLHRACFREWKRATRYKSSLKKVQDLRWQDSQRINKQIVFWSWKLHVHSVARPIQQRSAQLRFRAQCRHARLHFREWRKLVEIGTMQAFRLRRRVWRRWVEWRRRVQREKHAAHKEKITVVSVFFTAWHSTASEQATSRRSLNLAKRYVNRRRLRKLWVHWKYFSMAKRKYTQDSTKAFKHYFIKLLRASWGVWKQRTHANLQRAKTHKYGTLQRHFDAFRAGIQLVRAQKARARMLAHLKRRQQWVLLRRALGGWRGNTICKKRCKRNAELVAAQHTQGALSSVWRHWRLLHAGNLNHQLKILRSTYDNAVHEKHELEAHLQAAKDTAVSLSDQIEILHERSKGEDEQVGEIEHKLRLCEERNASLESELKGARLAIERERHAWEDALCEEEDKRESDSVKYRSLAQENQVLQVQVIELKRELEAEKAKVVGAEQVNEDLRAASVDAASGHQAELSAALDRQKELEREMAELRGHLKEQEAEREDTANRLQEYEKRIASTCEAMNEHERAHEQENERLRSEFANIEAKWKEEQAKNEELTRLLQEKNELILNMTHRVNQVDLESHPGHEHCDTRHGNQEDCGRKALRTGAASSCRRHPAGKPPTKPHDHLSTTMVRSRSFSMGKSGKRPVRRSGYAVPVRPLGAYNSEGLESPMEANAMAEEVMIDKHTSKVHEDIRLLQERISKRLEQVPAYAQLPPRLLQRVGRPVFRGDRELDSPVSSCSSLSGEDSDTAEENQSINDRIRRARLRRLHTQKQAMVMAVSPAVTRFASRSQLPTALKAKESENVALSANLAKKKPVRKLNSARVSAEKPQSSKKKITTKQQLRHAGRAL
jgi:hypothetical protein